VVCPVTVETIIIGAAEGPAGKPWGPVTPEGALGEGGLGPCAAPLVAAAAVGAAAAEVVSAGARRLLQALPFGTEGGSLVQQQQQQQQQ